MDKLPLAGVETPLMSAAELQEGIAALSRGLYFKEASLDMMLTILTESASRMSGVERVSIWALTDKQQELCCLDLFERRSGKHSKGPSLRATDNRAYFEALQNASAIVADDARLHPAFADFAISYLQPNNISAVLDTTIHIRGELQGVLSFEQVGTPQPWTPAHRMFAQAVANLVTLALVEYEAEEARRQAQRTTAQLRAVFDAAQEAMFLADSESGHLIDLNCRAEALVERRREELSGLSLAMLYPPDQQARVAGEFRRLRESEKPWALLTELQRKDGRRVAVELSAQLADLGDGRQLALGVFRPF